MYVCVFGCAYMFVRELAPVFACVGACVWVRVCECMCVFVCGCVCGCVFKSSSVILL